MKRNATYLIRYFLLSAASITFLSMALSYTATGFMNPFRSFSGLFHILSDTTSFSVISEDPKIILAQPNENIFVEYMESMGFTEIQAKRLGSIRIFTNGDVEESIVYRQNRFFSRWQWEKTYENKGRYF